MLGSQNFCRGGGGGEGASKFGAAGLFFAFCVQFLFLFFIHASVLDKRGKKKIPGIYIINVLFPHFIYLFVCLSIT